MSRPVEHGQGIPGLFFKYDMEPMSLILHERTTSLIQFLVRLAGMIGGIVVCTGWTFRLVDRFVQKIVPGIIEEEEKEGLSQSDYSPLPFVSPLVKNNHSSSRRTLN
ncbi:hypothetical protein PGT21_013394 [Puccinia graminis f. sp. tritici]|nr:hypothetical protein PGT21_013394 [Puccinia graminis f. sp. tritici]KAA1104953.1 hypothetical protein PGTUg99_008043 [Puccinia graminis f. sp. tritici]